VIADLVDICRFVCTFFAVLFLVAALDVGLVKGLDVLLNMM
jgi:hypothetical protein